ncbi:MAG: response regulator transcription factor [Phycisphaerae bacterium]|nr:response regulator transcription factor [Phycisphaerae bacterium]
MRVLVVEDYKPLRDSLVQALQEDGYVADQAADGKMALWYAQEGVHDVVILDLMLPGVDGLTVLRTLRRREARPCVLILTARDTTEDRVGGLDAGADDYLTKPFALAELLARVRALVRRRYQQSASVVEIGNMQLDTIARTVRRAGESIELTAREYALLEYLAMRASQVVSREDIWAHIYDANAALESNVVDVFVGLVRRKLERPGWPRLIHTRRGQGYVLEQLP